MGSALLRLLFRLGRNSGWVRYAVIGSQSFRLGSHQRRGSSPSPCCRLEKRYFLSRAVVRKKFKESYEQSSTIGSAIVEYHSNETPDCSGSLEDIFLVPSSDASDEGESLRNAICDCGDGPSCGSDRGCRTGTRFAPDAGRQTQSAGHLASAEHGLVGHSGPSGAAGR